MAAMSSATAEEVSARMVAQAGGRLQRQQSTRVPAKLKRRSSEADATGPVSRGLSKRLSQRAASSAIHPAEEGTQGPTRYEPKTGRQLAAEIDAKDAAPSCGCSLVPHSTSFGRHDGTKVQWKARAFASGNQCRAYKGKFTAGRLKGQKAVVKKLRGGSVTASDISSVPQQFVRDIEIAERAQRLAEQFMELEGVHSSIRFVVPDLVRVNSASWASDFVKGEYVTAEEFLAGTFQKFIANNGTLTHNKGTLSSFCHFTYHATRGDLIIVDIQGIMLCPGRYLLTDPSLHSNRKMQYGELDHGQDGIWNFFMTHECTSTCRHFRSPNIPDTFKHNARKAIKAKQEQLEDLLDESVSCWAHR